MAQGQTTRLGRGVWALLMAQAISTFNHSLLRSAMMALVSFGGLTVFGLSAEAIIAAGTVLIVLPYVLFSLGAGRLADRFVKSEVMTFMMGADVAIMSLGAFGLIVGNAAVLLVVLLLAGIQAALLGPAKFAMLPEIVPGDALVSANGWMSATGTVAVLLGLALGSALILQDVGFWALALGAPALALVGAASSFGIQRVPAKAPALSLKTAELFSDFGAIATMLKGLPLIVWPLVGSCWFWFQGTVLTALLPLFVARTGQAGEVASVYLVSTTLGVALGALLANQLVRRRGRLTLALGLIPVVTIPMLDLALWPHGDDAFEIGRLALDLLVTSAGAGFYLVPLSAAIQRLTPPDERARFVAISHTLSGLAMCLGGVTIFVYPLIGLTVADMFLVLAVITGGVGALSLFHTLHPTAWEPLAPEGAFAGGVDNGELGGLIGDDFRNETGRDPHW